MARVEVLRFVCSEAPIVFPTCGGDEFEVLAGSRESDARCAIGGKTHSRTAHTHHGTHALFCDISGNMLERAAVDARSYHGHTLLFLDSQSFQVETVMLFICSMAACVFKNFVMCFG